MIFINPILSTLAVVVVFTALLLAVKSDNSKHQAVNMLSLTVMVSWCVINWIAFSQGMSVVELIFQVI